MDRKKFVRTIFRMGMFAALAALVAVFYRNRQLELYADCKDVNNCKACGRFSSCSLPEAVKSRKDG